MELVQVPFANVATSYSASAWEAHLEELPNEPWDLYTDYPRDQEDACPKSQSCTVAKVTIELPADVLARADEASLLAALCVTLGNCDHGRDTIWVLHAAGSGKEIGDSSLPLPFAIDLRKGTFEELPRRITEARAQLTAAAGTSPGAAAALSAAVTRRQAGGRFRKRRSYPLCQVAFFRHESDAGIIHQVLDGAAFDPKFDFDFSLFSGSQDGVTLRESPCLAFRSDLYEEVTALRLASHVKALLSARARWASTSLNDAAELIGDSEERVRIARREAWCAAEATSFNHQVPYVHQLFEGCAHRTSVDDVALVPSETSNTAWTYSQLASASAEVASALVTLGLEEAGGRVPLLVRRSPALVVAIYGTLRAGQAYVPLDPSWPDARQCVVIEDVEAGALIVGDGVRPPIGSGCPDPPIVHLDSVGRPGTSVLDYCCNFPQPQPESSAYILYTSGTTGKPKGVDVPHLGLAGRTEWLQHTWPLGAEHAMVQKTPATFAISEWELFWPLCYGARLVLAADGLHADPQHVAQLISEHGVTHSVFVPSLLDQLIDELDGRLLPSLGCIICCGEALRPPTIKAAQARLPSAELVNLYGPTEGSMTVLRYPPKARSKDLLRFPVGVPIERTVVLCSCNAPPTLTPSPGLIRGEIGFGGPLIATGYWKLPQLTSQKFIDNPHGEGRIYQTGDLGRWRADDCLEFLGRMDQQVKFNGVRIELGEIESTLSGLPGVLSAAAFLAPPSHLVAACALVNGGGSRSAGSEAENADAERPRLLEALRTSLPKHTVPTRLEILSSLPLTDRSKIDRKRLLEDFCQREEQRAVTAKVAAVALTSRMEDMSRTERLIEQAMREVLDVSFSISLTASFQELGFSSLLLGKLTTRVRRSCALPGLPATAVYQHPTAKKLAAHVDEECDRERRAYGSNVDSDVDLSIDVATHVWRGESATSLLSWTCTILGIVCQSIVCELAFLPAYYILFFILFTYGKFAVCVCFTPVLLADAFFTLSVHILLKWLVLGRRVPGNYPIFGWYYWKWWFVHVIEHYIETHVSTFLSDTVCYSVVLSILGAKIGAGVRLNKVHISDADLITIGDGVRVEREATLSPSRLWGGELILRPISIGKGAYVAHRAFLPCGTELAADMELTPMASTDRFGSHHKVPRKDSDAVPVPSLGLTLLQVCFGVPIVMGVEALAEVPVIYALAHLWSWYARFLSPEPKGKKREHRKHRGFLSPGEKQTKNKRKRWGWGVISGYREGYTLQDKQNVLYPFCASIPWVMTFVHGLSYFVLVVLVKWVIIGKFREGPVRGNWNLFKRWLLERLVTTTTFDDFMGLWVNTEILSCCYRLLGANIAMRVNMDFFGAVEYDLISIERDVVFGSSVLLSNTFHGTSRPISLLRGACILDHSCVMSGSRIPEGTLLGSFTVVPHGQELDAMTVYTGCEQGTCVRLFRRPLLPGEQIQGERVALLATEADGANANGHVHLPPIALKQRELEAKALQAHQSALWFSLFNAWCALSAILFAPLPDLVYWMTLLIDFEIYDLFKDSDLGEVVSVCLIPAIFFIVNVVQLLTIAFLKWMMIGRWKSGDRPYYSSFHFRWAAMMVAFSSLNDHVAQIAGTWLSVAFMRIMGAKVGKQVCFFGHGFEYDLLHIGDNVCIGPDCDVTAHTVENMVMKMEHVRFEEGASCMAGSVVMPGGQMEPWTTLVEHSQVLKGEVVPQGCAFGGLPAKLLRRYPRPNEASETPSPSASSSVAAAAGNQEHSMPLLRQRHATGSRGFLRQLFSWRRMRDLIGTSTIELQARGANGHADVDFEGYESESSTHSGGLSWLRKYFGLRR